MNKLAQFVLLIMLLTGCVSKKTINQYSVKDLITKEQRIKQLQTLERWTITGKLAFIEPNRRESTSLFWEVNKRQHSQNLQLTTYLGINVLSLHSKNGTHTLEVDGKSYQDDDLELLIYSLTQLNLPTQALQHWLKGLVFSPKDVITYDTKTGLPKSILSTYNKLPWQVTYSDYKTFEQIPLATRITVKQNQLTLKIRINHWTF